MDYMLTLILMMYLVAEKMLTLVLVLLDEKTYGCTKDLVMTYLSLHRKYLDKDGHMDILKRYYCKIRGRMCVPTSYLIIRNDSYKRWCPIDVFLVM